MRQKFLTRFLPLLIALLAFTAHAQDYPKSLTISYVKHQAVIKLYKPLIEKAYAKLGIKVNFFTHRYRTFFNLYRSGQN